jgi:hypothetical protein
VEIFIFRNDISKTPTGFIQDSYKLKFSYSLLPFKGGVGNTATILTALLARQGKKGVMITFLI